MRKIGVGIGLMLHVPGVMALLSIPIALFFNETFAVKAFAWTGAGCLLLAQGLFHLSKNRSEEFSLTEMMWIASLGWLLASSFAALPFYLIAISLPAPQLATYQMEPFTEWINAHFEGLSGITSTGLTVSISESNLPFSMQWWRTFLQWVGAIGIIVFVSTFYKSFRTVSDHYSQGEEKEEILPDVEVRWYKIWWIYLLLTAFSIILLLVQKVPWWEAVNHGMTAIATGGFTVLDDSVELYDSRLKLSLIFIMVLGALNFNLYHLLFLKGKWKRFLGDQQHIFFVCFMISGSVFLLLGKQYMGRPGRSLAGFGFSVYLCHFHYGLYVGIFGWLAQHLSFNAFPGHVDWRRYSFYGRGDKNSPISIINKRKFSQYPSVGIQL